jgi:tetratricopeptide (TPR) repeat protein
VSSLQSALEAFQAAVARAPAARRFTDAQLEAVYAIAHRLFEHGRYERAARHFGFLTLYRPASARFLKGLGASQFMERDFDRAAATWALLVLLEPEDAEAAYLFARAALMRGEGAHADAALARAIELAEPGSPVAEHAHALLALISA